MRFILFFLFFYLQNNFNISLLEKIIASSKKIKTFFIEKKVFLGRHGSPIVSFWAIKKRILNKEPISLSQTFKLNYDFYCNPLNSFLIFPFLKKVIIEKGERLLENNMGIALVALPETEENNQFKEKLNKLLNNLKTGEGVAREPGESLIDWRNRRKELEKEVSSLFFELQILAKKCSESNKILTIVKNLTYLKVIKYFFIIPLIPFTLEGYKQDIQEKQYLAVLFALIRNMLSTYYFFQQRDFFKRALQSPKYLKLQKIDKFLTQKGAPYLYFSFPFIQLSSKII